MQTLFVFANDLAKYFVLSKNKKVAAMHIVYEINSRIDSNMKHLTEDDKRIILHLIEDFISGNQQFILKPGEMIITKQKDHDEFIAFKKYINDHVLMKK